MWMVRWGAFVSRFSCGQSFLSRGDWGSFFSMYLMHYVKHFEFPLCMKCATQINLACLWCDCQRACYITWKPAVVFCFKPLSSLFILLFYLVKGNLLAQVLAGIFYIWTWALCVSEAQVTWLFSSQPQLFLAPNKQHLLRVDWRL